MIQPVRLHRSRAKGARLVSPNGLPIVCVTRPGPWGNPFEVVLMTEDGEKELRGINSEYRCFTALEAVVRFTWFLRQVKVNGGGRMWACEIWDNLEELRGKNLACFCKIGEPCHADVLLKIANE